MKIPLTRRSTIPVEMAHGTFCRRIDNDVRRNPRAMHSESLIIHYAMENPRADYNFAIYGQFLSIILVALYGSKFELQITLAS